VYTSDVTASDANPPAAVDQIQLEFELFHKAHPEVYELLKRLCLNALAAGLQSWA
jgi:hypothetical protein